MLDTTTHSPDPSSLLSVLPLDRGDTDAIVAFVLSLDQETRQLRFLHALAPAAIRAHYERLDWASTAVFGWFEGDTLRGLAEAYMFEVPGAAGTTREAELAFLIDPRIDDQPGLDLLVLCALPEVARRGCHRSTLHLARGDHLQRRRLAALGARLDPSGEIATLLH